MNRRRRAVQVRRWRCNGREFEATLAAAGVDLLRPARKGEAPRPGGEFFKPLRQVIESINYSVFKGQLDLEQHGGHTPAGVWVRIMQRVLALTAAIWHNDRTRLSRSKRSLPGPTTTDSPGISHLVSGPVLVPRNVDSSTSVSPSRTVRCTTTWLSGNGPSL